MSNKSRLIGLSVALIILAVAFFGWFSLNNGQIGLAQAGKPITVCASGCDFSKIQAAIDAVQSGSTIQIQAGTYKENLTITGKQGLTLQGVGMNVATLDGSAGVAVQSPAISIQNSQRITIQGLKIIKSRRGVAATGTTGLVLANNSFQNNLRQAIALGLAQGDALLTGNLIQNTQLDQDGTHGEGVNLIDSHATLKGNTITGNASYGIVGQGESATQGGSTVTMEQNTVSGNGNIGVGLYSASTATMQQNTISDNGDIGVGVYAASSATIDGNTIARNVAEGIFVTASARAQITNNQITASKIRSGPPSCCGFGINLRQNAQATIQGNTISQNTSFGIVLQESSQATIKQNTITNNGSRGVELVGNSTATIDGNTITGNVLQGIILEDSSQATITNNQITGNKVNTSGIAGQGIFILGASRATITKNTIKSNNSDGIVIGNPGTANETVQAEISSNTIQNNSGCGAFADSDVGTKITGQGNTISGNTKGQLCGATSKFPPGFGGGK